MDVALLFADANRDPRVDSTDDLLIADGAPPGPTGWSHGDFTCDGVIDIDSWGERDDCWGMIVPEQPAASNSVGTLNEQTQNQSSPRGCLRLRGFPGRPTSA